LIDLVETDEDFSLSVIEAFKRGSRKGLAASNLFESFGLASSPFDTNLLINNPTLITDKTKNLVNNLAERIGACYQSQTSILVVSPEGAGRTTVLKLLNATLNKGLDKNFSSYIHAPNEWSGLSLKKGNEDDGEEERTDNFQRWMKEIDFYKTRIVLIDDADAFVPVVNQYMNALKFEQLQVPTMVFCVTPTTQAHISKSDVLKEIFADIFWIMPFDKHDIREMLVKSIDAVKGNASPFEDSAIDKIADYCLGLPGAAVRLALVCLKSAYQIGISKVNKTLVERVALNEGFDLSLQLLKKEIKLDGTKYNVAIEILSQFFIRGGNVERTTVLSRFSDMATSTLSYHLKDLINSGIIKQERIGYKVYYVMSKPVRSALEMMNLPSLEANDAH
jgi:DNA-binding transcriptional ArsR family regulator